MHYADIYVQLNIYMYNYLYIDTLATLILTIKYKPVHTSTYGRKPNQENVNTRIYSY